MEKTQNTNFTPVDTKNIEGTAPKEGKKMGARTVVLLIIIALASLSLIGGITLISSRQNIKTPAVDVVDESAPIPDSFGGDSVGDVSVGGDGVGDVSLEGDTVPIDPPTGVPPGDDPPPTSPIGDTLPPDNEVPPGSDPLETPTLGPTVPQCNLSVQISCTGCD